MIRFTCMKCKAVLQAAAEQAGATVGCPRCKFQMKVPSAAPVAKAPPQPAGPTPDWLNDMRAEQKADQRPPVAAPPSAAPTTAPWHFTRDGKRYGPYTTAQLKQFAGSGRLLPTDLVWKEGVEGGKPASAVKGLFPAKQPPSQPDCPAAARCLAPAEFTSLAAPKASPLTKAKRQWERLSRKVKLGIVGGAVVVPLFLISVVVIVIGGRSSTQSRPAESSNKHGQSEDDGRPKHLRAAEAELAKSGLEKSVTLSGQKYEEGFQVGYEKGGGQEMGQTYKKLVQAGNNFGADLEMKSIREQDADHEKNYENAVDVAQVLVRMGQSVPKNVSENIELYMGILHGFRQAVLDYGGVSLP